MKKTLVSLFAFFFILQLNAQTFTVNGVVSSDENKKALPQVTITEKGTGNSVLTDDQGHFSIKVSDSNAALLFNYVGYQTQEISIGGKPVIDVSLKGSSADLTDVVVTALGIKRELRSIGYATQEVSSKDIEQSRQPNLINALQGKVAGVTISSTGGGPGQSASILIRGINSLNPDKDNQPLFVIDGLPIDNSTFTTGTTGGRGVQMPNRLSDINPQDIESVNILRGGAATALYGLRGANGVVVITTKSGQAGALKVNFSSNYGIDEVNKIPDIQSTYTQGYLGEYDSVSFWPAWGPTVEKARQEDPTHPATLYNNWKRAFKTGRHFSNAVTFSGGTEKATFSSSLSHQRQDGVIPFTWYQDITARVGGQLKFSDKFRMGTTLYYANTDGNFYDADRYNEELIYWAPRWDVMDYIKPDGTQKTYGNGNPVYYAATNKFRSKVDHVIGSMNFSYSPFS